MNKVTSKVINRLAHYEGKKALTIYMPTIDMTSVASRQKNQTRLKNLIHQGIELLNEEQDIKLIDALTSVINEKLDNPTFWQDLTHSLAIFGYEQTVEVYHLPVEVTEQVYVGKTFDTLALYELQSMHQPFYIFALAQHDPKFFSGDIYGIEPVELELPRSVEDALNIDEMFINSNTVRAGSGSLQGSPHGQGDSQQAGQEERLMYFRILDDRILHSKLIDNDIPIILAATESEAADFRAVSKLPNLCNAHIPGNRTKDESSELHHLALTTIQQEMAKKEESSFQALYEEKRGADKATNDINEIQRAAVMGRIDTLMLGIFEKNNEPEAIIPLSEKSNLLELVHMVLRNGGTVQAINRMFIPGRAAAAAVLRY